MTAQAEEPINSETEIAESHGGDGEPVYVYQFSQKYQDYLLVAQENARKAKAIDELIPMLKEDGAIWWTDNYAAKEALDVIMRHMEAKG